MSYEAVMFKSPEVFELNKTRLPGTVSPAEEIARWRHLDEQQQMQKSVSLNEVIGVKATSLVSGLFAVFPEEDL